MIMITYIEIFGATGESAIIWNYIETIEAWKSIRSNLEFGCTCNYTSDNSNKTT